MNSATSDERGAIGKETEKGDGGMKHSNKTETKSDLDLKNSFLFLSWVR
jgi:hypothetical protein